MNSIEYIVLLKRRGFLFREYAGDALRRGHFDLSVFYAEKSLSIVDKAFMLLDDLEGNLFGA